MSMTALCTPNVCHLSHSDFPGIGLKPFNLLTLQLFNPIDTHHLGESSRFVGVIPLHNPSSCIGIVALCMNTLPSGMRVEPRMSNRILFQIMSAVLIPFLSRR
jgi:hypothetical protein